MSALNLMPWRERRRQSALRRWGWGTALMLSLSTSLVAFMDQHLQSWQQQHAQQQQEPERDGDRLQRQSLAELTDVRHQTERGSGHQ